MVIAVRLLAVTGYDNEQSPLQENVEPKTVESKDKEYAEF